MTIKAEINPNILSKFQQTPAFTISNQFLDLKSHQEDQGRRQSLP
jgi:hypothetical protein